MADWLNKFIGKSKPKHEFREPNIKKLASEELKRTEGFEKLSNGSEWLHGEVAICSEYYQAHGTNYKIRENYEKCADYLHAADEFGRKPVGKILLIAAIVMTFIEAVMFSFILNEYFAAELPGKYAIYTAILVGLIIAIALVYITHAAGAEGYFAQVIAKIRNWRDDDVKIKKDKGYDGDISSTFNDKDKSTAQRLFNRIGNKEDGSLKAGLTWRIAALVVVLFIACGAAYIRYEAYNKSLETKKTELENTAIEDAKNSTSNETAALDQNRTQTTIEEQIKAERAAAMMAFAVFGVVFLAAQFMGYSIGKNHTFASAKGKEAYDEINGFTDANEYEEYHAKEKEKIADMANKQISELRRTIRELGAKGDGLEIKLKEMLDKPEKRDFETFVYVKLNKLSASQGS